MLISELVESKYHTYGIFKKWIQLLVQDPDFPDTESPESIVDDFIFHLPNLRGYSGGQAQYHRDLIELLYRCFANKELSWSDAPVIAGYIRRLATANQFTSYRKKFKLNKFSDWRQFVDHVDRMIDSDTGSRRTPDSVCGGESVLPTGDFVTLRENPRVRTADYRKNLTLVQVGKSFDLAHYLKELRAGRRLILPPLGDPETDQYLVFRKHTDPNGRECYEMTHTVQKIGDQFSIRDSEGNPSSNHTFTVRYDTRFGVRFDLR